MTMRTIRSLSMLAIALSFGAITFGARTAHAVPCCSSEPCQREFPPPQCDNCTPTCVDDEAEPVSDEIVYDEVESICYVNGEVPLAFGADSESVSAE